MCITLWGEWNVWVSKFICSMQYFNLCIFCFLFNVGLTCLTTHLMCPFWRCYVSVICLFLHPSFLTHLTKLTGSIFFVDQFLLLLIVQNWLSPSTPSVVTGTADLWSPLHFYAVSRSSQQGCDPFYTALIPLLDHHEVSHHFFHA